MISDLKFALRSLLKDKPSLLPLNEAAFSAGQAATTTELARS